MKYMTAIMLAVAFPAAADEFTLPDGCEGFATVQAKDCTVTHYFRCEGDAPGWKRRVDLDEEGLTFQSRTDEEARWIESVSAHDGVVDHLGIERDPASFSTLLETGYDDWDFFVLSSDGAKQRYIGYDRLTGEEVTFGDVTLKRTEFSMRVEDAEGRQLWSSEGREFVAPEWNTFIGGERTVTGPNGSFDSDGSPERILLPGDDGFMARRPIYGCGMMMSGWPAPGFAG